MSLFDGADEAKAIAARLSLKFPIDSQRITYHAAVTGRFTFPPLPRLEYSAKSAHDDAMLRGLGIKP